MEPRQIVISHHSVWDAIEVLLTERGLQLVPMPVGADDLPTWFVGLR